MASKAYTEQSLLAVDLGLRTGLALFGRNGRLIWYRSAHMPNRSSLRRFVGGLLAETTGLAWLVLEGGGPIAETWEREAKKYDVGVRHVTAECWRRKFLYQRQQRNARQAKYEAGKAAMSVIEWSGVSRPTSLRHDTSEAILTGLWGVMEVGWLCDSPLGRKP